MNTPRDAASVAEIYTEVAYCFDGSFEGLLSAIFAAYARHEHPTDVCAEGLFQPRLGQNVVFVETNVEHAERVYRGLVKQCGYQTFHTIKKASLSSAGDAGSVVYRFVRYAMDEQKRKDCAHCRKQSSCSARRGSQACPRLVGRAISDITHPAVADLYARARSVDQECEHMRQFIRFDHLKDESVDVWFARCNPRDNVVPLIMNHFVDRLSLQAFIIYDENHNIAGVYDGASWYLVHTDDPLTTLGTLPALSSEDALMKQAWRSFYKTVAIDARYNPELRRSFMPKRFWCNLTEMQEDRVSIALTRQSK